MITTNASRLPTLQVVILAAGASRRLGQPKPLARIHGVALLRSTALKVRGLSRVPPIIVAPARSSALRCSMRGLAVRWISNPQRAAGQSTSVRLGIKMARFAPAVLILPCDLAQLKRRDLIRMVARWRSGHRYVVARRVGSESAGAPLILPRVHYPLAQQMTGDIGLRDLVNTLPVGQKRLLWLPSAADDIDTRRHLDAARRRWRAMGVTSA